MASPRPAASIGAVLAWMTLVMLWSGVLAAGFAYSAIAGDELSTTRRLVYTLLAGFTGLLALRTGWEMLLKIRQRRVHRPRHNKGHASTR